MLLRNCHLDAEQRTQLAMKRAGTQPFQEVADLLRTLDRPEAFLQQSKATPVVKRAHPLAIEEPAENPDDPTGLTQPEVIGGLRALVLETIQDMVPSNTALSASQADSEDTADLQSNSDFDAEGQLKLDIEREKEYSEGESLQILAYHTGRAQVRRDLLQDKRNRGYRPPPKVRARNRRPNFIL